MTDPFSPNETPLPLENVNADRLLLAVPAEMFTAESNPAVLGAVYEPVIVDPLKPNESPLLFDSTNAERLLLVVPADRFTLLIKPAVLGTV
jgi:hypothetical protein